MSFPHECSQDSILLATWLSQTRKLSGHILRYHLVTQGTYDRNEWSDKKQNKSTKTFTPLLDLLVITSFLHLKKKKSSLVLMTPLVQITAVHPWVGEDEPHLLLRL